VEEDHVSETMSDKKGAGGLSPDDVHHAQSKRQRLEQNDNNNEDAARNEPLAEKKPLSLDKVNEEVREAFFSLVGFLKTEYWAFSASEENSDEKAPGQVLLERFQRDVSKYPELTQVVTPDTRQSLLNIVTYYSDSTNKDSNLLLPAIKFLISENPTSLLWKCKKYSSWNEDTMTMNMIIEQHYCGELFPWIVGNFPFLLMHPVALADSSPISAILGRLNRGTRTSMGLPLPQHKPCATAITNFYRLYPDALFLKNMWNQWRGKDFPIFSFLKLAYNLGADFLKWAVIQYQNRFDDSSLLAAIYLCCLNEWQDQENEYQRLYDEPDDDDWYDEDWQRASGNIDALVKVCDFMVGTFPQVAEHVFVSKNINWSPNRIAKLCKGRIEAKKFFLKVIRAAKFNHLDYDIFAAWPDSQSRCGIEDAAPLLTKEAYIANERVKIGKTCLLIQKYADPRDANNGELYEAYSKWARERLGAKLVDNERVQQIRKDIVTAMRKGHYSI
jgi:hypothetical protein